MVLAFQCGEAHVNEFEESLSKANMDRWENWFSKYPQGQYHRDNMQAFAASMQCAANGMDIEPSQFLWYEKAKPEEELSVDDAWGLVAGMIPVATPKPVSIPVTTPEEKPNA